MIEQHQYGRIFIDDVKTMDNYSTLVGSPGLKIKHIKEYLEPLCKYAISTRQDSVYKTDLIQDRRTLMIAPIPTGELVIGQTSMSKFGENSGENYFVHNYILSNSEKLRYIKVPEKVFGVTQFEARYNDKEENKLGILAAIPYEESNPYFRNKVELFYKIGIDELYFKKLIETIIIAVNYDKKVWISIRGVGRERELYIRALMYHIYKALPWCICEKTGLITTAKWKICCPNIHILFLEENDSYNDEQVGEDYLFDFVDCRFFNVDNTIDISCYLDFVERYGENKAIHEKLNLYILEVTKAMGSDSRRNIRMYNYISTIIRVYMNSIHNVVYIIDKKEREGLLWGLVSILNLPIKVDIKRELQNLILDVVVSLEVDLKVGSLFEKEEIEAMIELVHHYDDHKKFDRVMNTIIINIKKAYQNNEHKYIEYVFKSLKEDINLYRHVIRELYKDQEIRNNIIYVQLRNKMESCNDISGMMMFIQEIESIGEVLVKDTYYKELVLKTVEKCINETKDMYALFMFVRTYCKDKAGNSFVEVLQKVERAFVEKINFDHINTEEELLKLEFTYEYDDINYIAIKQYKDLITDISNMSPENLKVNKLVQERVKCLYRNLIRQDRYYMLIYAFLEKDETRSDGWKMNLDSAFEYLVQISAEDLLQFIIWLKGQKLYIDYERFDEDIVIFLINQIKTGTNINYKLVKRYFSNNNKMKSLYKKIRKTNIKTHFIFYGIGNKMQDNIEIRE